MKRLVAFFGGILTIAATGPVFAATFFEATLEGAQEVPPQMTAAGGRASLILNDAQDRLEINIQISGLDLDGTQTPGINFDDVTRAHIHVGARGSNGGIVFGFIDPNSDLNGDLAIDAAAGTIFSAWDLNEGNGTNTLGSQLSNLLSNDLYINIHTVAIPSGEIRGQIEVVPIPAAAWLFASGLLGLAALTRRKKSA